MSDIHNGAQRGSKHLVTVEMGEKQVFLLGTAHISQESVDAVTQAINEIAFEHVVIEIDEQRYRTMKDRKSWESLNIFQIIRKRKMFLLLCNVILASFQRRIGADIGVLPGAEMLAAIQAAQQKRIPFSFGDRAVPVTLRRAWAKSGFWGKK